MFNNLKYFSIILFIMVIVVTSRTLSLAKINYLNGGDVLTSSTIPSETHPSSQVKGYIKNDINFNTVVNPSENHERTHYSYGWAGEIDIGVECLDNKMYTYLIYGLADQVNVENGVIRIDNNSKIVPGDNCVTERKSNGDSIDASLYRFATTAGETYKVQAFSTQDPDFFGKRMFVNEMFEINPISNSYIPIKFVIETQDVSSTTADIRYKANFRSTGTTRYFYGTDKVSVESVPEYSDVKDVTHDFYVDPDGVWYPIHLNNLEANTKYYIKAVQYSEFDKYNTGSADLYRAESQVTDFTTLP